MKLDIDYSRLASYVEDLAPLETREVARVAVRFRNEQLRRFPIVLAPDQLRDRALAKFDNPFGFDSLIPDAAAGIAEILCTPRALKSALRRCRAAWQSLHGEVDFDDLFMMCALYESDRRIEIPSRRSAKPNGDGAETVRAIDALRLGRAALADLGSTLDSERKYAEAWKKMLLSDASSEHVILKELLSPKMGSGTSRLQGVATSHPTDYLTRIRSESHDDVPRDQAVLGVLNTYRQEKLELGVSNRKQIAKWLCQNDLASKKVEQFCELLGGDRLLLLIDETISQILSDQRLKPIVHDGPHRDAPLSALIELARILRRRRIRLEKLVALLRRRLADAIRVDLNAMTEIEYWLAPRSEYRPEDQGVVHRAAWALEEDVCTIACEWFSGQEGPDRLRRSFTPGVPWCLSYLIRRSWQKPHERRSKPEWWRRMIPALIEASGREPSGVCVGFALLFASSDSVVDAYDPTNIEAEADDSGDQPRPFQRRTVIRIDEAYAKEFLGPAINEAMSVLANVVPPPEIKTAIYVESVREFARNWNSNSSH
ncbi:MAG: hypothetical protein JSS51_09540 [Planctomycetes bacterium]|nr:hypothetical protein [Planctomycetota bacterium]